MIGISENCALISTCHGLFCTRNCLFSVSRQPSPKQAPVPPKRQPGVRPPPFPKGYCFAYCSYGRCTNAKCAFLHWCPSCNGQHASSQCRGNGPASTFTRPAGPFTRPHIPLNDLLPPPSQLPTPVHAPRPL